MGQLAHPGPAGKEGMLGHNGRKLDHEHREVKRDAHDDFPQNRVGIPEHQAVPKTVWAANVKQERKQGAGVPQQADKDGHASDRFILFQSEQVDGGREQERTCPQSDGRNVNCNP
jgi:hypothetical protein